MWKGLGLFFHSFFTKVTLKCIFMTMRGLLCSCLKFLLQIWNCSVHEYAIYPIISTYVDMECFLDLCFLLEGSVFAFITTSDAAVNIQIYLVSFKYLFLPSFQNWVIYLKGWPLRKSVMLLFSYIKKINVIA